MSCDSAMEAFDLLGVHIFLNAQHLTSSWQLQLPVCTDAIKVETSMPTCVVDYYRPWYPCPVFSAIPSFGPLSATKRISYPLIPSARCYRWSLVHVLVRPTAAEKNSAAILLRLISASHSSQAHDQNISLLQSFLKFV